MLFLSKKYARELRKMKYERNTLVKNKINNLPLVRPFALMAVKLHMFGGKTCHVATLLEHVFFVPCPCLDATDGIVCRFQYIFLGVIQCMFFLLVDNGF